MSNPNKTIIRSKALDLLANREHTKFELQRKLSAKGFAAFEIYEVMEELAQQGLQSNQRFLESYVNSNTAGIFSRSPGALHKSC